jgi:hypothetical protein
VALGQVLMIPEERLRPKLILSDQLTAGYLLLHIFTLTLLVIAVVLRSMTPSPNVIKTFKRVYETFYSCAVFLTLAVQIAASIMLARTNFGESTAGMGAYTLEILWTVCILTMLPLMIMAFFPELAEFSHIHSEPFRGGDELNEESRKTHLRFILYIACWICSIYPFASSVVSIFGPSQIGDGPDYVISESDWDIISSICHAGLNRISDRESNAISALLVVCWLFIYISSLIKILCFKSLPIDKLPGSGLIHRLLQPVQSLIQRVSCRRGIIMIVIIEVLSAAQFWSYLRLWVLQMEMAKVLNNNDVDLDLNFGQVVAITVFAPVLVEGIYWAALDFKSKPTAARGGDAEPV